MQIRLLYQTSMQTALRLCQRLTNAVKTKRHYIAVFKQFAKWLHDTGRLSKKQF